MTRLRRTREQGGINPTACVRCELRQPAPGHEAACRAWYAQMATVEAAARRATALSPSFPVTGAQAIELLAHLRTRKVASAETVVQVALDLGWRPFQAALAAPVLAESDPLGTGDLLELLPAAEPP